MYNEWYNMNKQELKEGFLQTKEEEFKQYCKDEFENQGGVEE